MDKSCSKKTLWFEMLKTQRKSPRLVGEKEWWWAWSSGTGTPTQSQSGNSI